MSLSEGQKRAIGYLITLDEGEALRHAQSWNADSDDFYQISSAPIKTAQDCIECLSTFLGEGVHLSHLFNHGNIWQIYLKSISEERYHKAISLLCVHASPLDLMLYFRATYRLGFPAIPDQEYDILERFYLATYPSLKYLETQTQDDDELTSIVKEALKLSGRKDHSSSVPVQPMVLCGEAASLNSEKSTSIKPVRSYEEVLDYLQSCHPSDVHWSLKVDGVNTKCLFDHGLKVALSRGRSSDSWDYTESVRRIFKAHGWDPTQLSGKLTGETIVSLDALEKLQAKYPDKDYKSPKSLAGAMLRAPQQFDEEDYSGLVLYPFEYAELSKADAFVQLSSIGMTLPPALITPWSAIPRTSVEDFSAWLDKTVLDPLWEEAQSRQIGTDGVVLQLISAEETDRADKYSDTNIALKFSHWTEAEYTARVVGIQLEQRRVEMSVVLEIEPTTTRDLNVATRVSIGSPAILVNDNIRIGDTIAFTRKSEAINIYLEKR